MASFSKRLRSRSFGCDVSDRATIAERRRSDCAVPKACNCENNFLCRMERAAFCSVDCFGCDKAPSRTHHQPKEPLMRLLPIIAAAGIGLFAVTAVYAEGTSTQTGTGNPTGAQNMDASNK